MIGNVVEKKHQRDDDARVFIVTVVTLGHQDCDVDNQHDEYKAEKNILVRKVMPRSRDRCDHLQLAFEFRSLSVESRLNSRGGSSG